MGTTQATFGAFNQGGVPTIACFNKAKTALGVNFDALIAAMQMFVDRHVAPVWGTPAKLIKSKGFVKGAWAMVFLDNADQPGALAYHDLTPDGLPQSKVFVKTTLENKNLVSVSASHELVEMLVDPAINLMTTGPDPEGYLCVRERGSGRSAQLPRPWHSDDRLCLSGLLRSLSQVGLGAVRSSQEGQEAVPDTLGWLPDHLQERQVEPSLRLCFEEKALCA